MGLKNKKSVNKPLYIFMMSSDAALQAFEIYKELKITDEKSKQLVLLELAKIRTDIRIIKTGRTKQQVLQDYSKHYKILRMKPKQ